MPYNPHHTLATMHIAEKIKKPTTHTYPTDTDSAECQNHDIQQQGAEKDTSQKQKAKEKDREHTLQLKMLQNSKIMIHNSKEKKNINVKRSRKETKEGGNSIEVD